MADMKLVTIDPMVARAICALFGYKDGEIVLAELELILTRIACLAQQQERERAAKLAEAMAANCQDCGSKHFCEQFGCTDLASLAAAIRKDQP